MCRVAGFLDRTSFSYDPIKVVGEMRDCLAHGGPDDAGDFFDAEHGVALGHRRLSIIDVSESGHQPMQFEHLHIVYNGELYNYREVRLELEALGYQFTSQSDTEVLLKAFHKWGVESVNKFRGMWAFAIWNSRDKNLILCRDRVGVKPLYWYLKDGLFIFASELKAFHKHPEFKKEISEKGLAFYMQYGYITSPYSIFRYTFKVEPGHFLTINSKGSIKHEKYWDAETAFVEGADAAEAGIEKSEEEYKGELENLLIECAGLRTVSDVPIGLFLSGGIDSSVVAAVLQKQSTTPLKTFTIGFRDAQMNEADYAAKVANHLGTEHQELYCEPKEAQDVIPLLPEIYDEPHADSSAIPTVLVSRLARNNVKVSLSADGGDELFFGYSRYLSALDKSEGINMNKSRFFRTLNMLQPAKLLDDYGKTTLALKNNTSMWNKYSRWWTEKKGQEMYSWYDIYSKLLQETEVQKLGVKKTLSHLFKFNYPRYFDKASIMMLYDLKNYLPEDILSKVDRATMSVGLEGREPLLDHRLIEFSARLPLNMKYRDGQSKYLLRRILEKYVPRELTDRPKQGFSLPIHKWFRKELKDLLQEAFAETNQYDKSKLDIQEVRKVFESYISGNETEFNKVYHLFIYLSWYKRWMN